MNAGKHPAEKGYSDAASSDILKSRWKWLDEERYPAKLFPRGYYPNIGLLTGAVSSVTVLDVDVRDDKNGALKLVELEGCLGTLPDTATQLSGSRRPGAEHRFFKNASAIQSDIAGALGKWGPPLTIPDAKSDQAVYLWKAAKRAVAPAPQKSDEPLEVAWLSIHIDKVVRLLDTPELLEVLVGARSLRMNDMTSKPEIGGKAIKDIDDLVTSIRVACAERLRGTKVTASKKKSSPKIASVPVALPKITVYEALLHVAKRHRFHPVVEYLDSLVWDGVTRLENFLEGAFGMSWDDPCERELHKKYIR